MNIRKLLLLSSLGLGAVSLQGQILFTTGTGAYDDSDVVMTPSADLTADNATNYFFRETRAAMQTFVVEEAIDATAINTIVRRAVDGATFTLSLIDFGTDAPENFYTPADVAAAGSLATSNISITPALAFGQASGGITVADDPYTTMTWTLPSTVSLVPGRTYAFILDGTSAAPGNIVMQFGLGNPYAGGLAYRQEESESLNFRSGNDYFGPNNNQQADWGLAIIPEPSTYAALFGLAALGLVLYRRRRRA